MEIQPRPGQPPKSHTRLWVVLGLVAVLLLCLAGAAIVGAIYWVRSINANDPAPSTAVAPSFKPHKFTVVVPSTLGPRSANETPEIKDQRDQLKAVFAGFDNPIAGAYGSVGNRDVVLFAASTVGPNARPNLDRIMYKVQIGRSTPITNYTQASPGSLGGNARCADMKIENMPVAVCGWTDSYSAGILVFHYKDRLTANEEFAALREEIERAG